MSKLLNAFVYRIGAFVLISGIFNIADAQTTQIQITVNAATKFVGVKGRSSGAKQPSGPINLYFRSAAAGENPASDRISDLKLSDADGKAVDVRRLAPGEYLAAGAFDAWSYDVILTNSKRNANVSWLGDNAGMLALDDLLPKYKGRDADRATVAFSVPAEWQISSLEKKPGNAVFDVESADKGVFYIGSSLRSIRVRSGGTSIELVIDGEWLFTDAEASAMVTEIFDFYQKLFGVSPGDTAMIAAFRLPKALPAGTWQAETRGRSINLVSSDMSFRSQSLQRLHEQLRHEIFHLWVPNAVNLTGSYDWFYEGFALYQSLKLAVSVNRIRFDDMLDTLSRAYEIDRRQSRRISLVEASQNRFGGNDTQVYARGMLVAFLADISLLDGSDGKVSISDILRKIVRQNGREAVAAEANVTIFEAMRSARVAPEIVEKYVKGAGQIAWDSFIAAAGLEAPAGDEALRVVAKPRGRQKAVLDKLGYNSWRKLK